MYRAFFERQLIIPYRLRVRTFMLATIVGSEITPSPLFTIQGYPLEFLAGASLYITFRFSLPDLPLFDGLNGWKLP